MALTAYQQNTQRLLHDPGAQAYSLSDLTVYINMARRQVAAEGQCVRQLLSGGTITALTVNSPGTGYSGTATVKIVGSGFQASATATIGAGGISGVTLVNGGWGYLTAPTVTATGSTGGSNATFNVTVDNSCSTVAGQEVYSFKTFNTLAATIPGIKSVIGCFSVAVSQGGTYKPMLEPYVFTEFQAYCRVYQNQAQNYPVIWSLYGSGEQGSIYMFPWPSQQNQMDIDAVCLPIDLVDDTTVEVIPIPFNDAVQYYAAYLAYLNSSRAEDAERMFKSYTRHMQRSRAQVDLPFFPNTYYDEGA